MCLKRNGDMSNLFQARHHELLLLTGYQKASSFRMYDLCLIQTCVYGKHQGFQYCTFSQCVHSKQIFTAPTER